MVHVYNGAFTFVVREDGGLVVEPYEGAPLAAYAPGIWAMILSNIDPTRIRSGNPEAAAAVAALAEDAIR